MTQSSTLVRKCRTCAPASLSTLTSTATNGTSSTTITRDVVITTTDTHGDGGPCAAIISDGAAANVYVTYQGDGCSFPGQSCSAKADVAFAVSSNGFYDLGCAKHTYSWDFGDGGHSAATAPSHRYTADGTYTVKVHFDNGKANADLTTTVKVVGATPSAPRGGHAVRH